MIRWPGQCRLLLLASLAAAQTTLLIRAGYVPFAILSGLSWLAGGVLLFDHERDSKAVATHGLGYLLVGWSLFVLTFAARLYDPVLHGIPFSSLVGLGLLAGLSFRSPVLGELALVGLLVPLQVLANRFLPTAALADHTADVSALILTLLGRPAVADGRYIYMLDRVLHVDASCTGINTLTLCAAATLVLLILLPPPLPVPKSRRRLRCFLSVFLLIAALVAAFLVNALRISLLGLSRTGADPHGLQVLSSFDFWHDGTGSHLFSLLAMGLICVIYLGMLECLLQLGARLPLRP